MGKGLKWFPPAFQLCSVMFLSQETGNGQKQSHILLRCFCMIPPGNTPFVTRRPLFVCFAMSSTSIIHAEERRTKTMLLCYILHYIYYYEKKIKKSNIIINPTKIIIADDYYY